MTVWGFLHGHFSNAEYKIEKNRDNMLKLVQNNFIQINFNKNDLNKMGGGECLLEENANYLI